MGGVRREMAKHDVRIRRRNERSQRSGNRRAIQSNFGWTSLHFPIQSGDELQRGKEINGMGEGASRSCSGFVWWSDQVDRKETCWCNKDKSVDAKSSTTSLRPVGLKEKSLFWLSSDWLYWKVWRLKECEISLCHWWAGRWPEASHRSRVVSRVVFNIEKSLVN